MLALVELVRSRFYREEGQGMVEYALIIALIALAVIVALAVLGTQISNLFNRISGNLSNAGIAS